MLHLKPTSSHDQLVALMLFSQMLHNHLQCLLSKIILMLHTVLLTASIRMNLFHNRLLQASHCQAKIAGSYTQSNELKRPGIIKTVQSYSMLLICCSPESSGLGAPPAKPVVDKQIKPFGESRSLHSFSLSYPSIIRCSPAEAISPATCKPVSSGITAKFQNR